MGPISDLAIANDPPSDASLTFAQLRVLGSVPRLLLAVLGLGGAPVALPLQHVADHHPQQAQEEENGHQDEGDVVGMRPVGSAAIFNVVCRIISCGGKTEGDKGKSCLRLWKIPTSFTGT